MPHRSSHGISHVDGDDDIQDATAAQKGLATAAQITKLDGITGTLQKQLMVMLAPSIGLAGNQTAYLAIFGAFTTPSSARIRFPIGKITRLTVNVTTNTILDDSVLKVYKNNAAVGTGVTYTTTLTGRLTVVEDIAVADGDLICIELVIGANSGKAIHLKEITIEYEQG